jgi:hypothetical protein
MSIEQALQSDFQRVNQFLEENAQASKLPWLHSFPKNSCEAASAYLAKALEVRHPSLLISVVKGTGKEGMHFWVEVHGFVMDLTIDPFDESRAPIIDFAPHPSHDLFDEVVSMCAETAWTNLEFGCLKFLESLQRRLELTDVAGS